VKIAKYLGVPFSSKGAQWDLLQEQQLERANHQLEALQTNGANWPEWIRLQLVSMFLLPKADYCASLAYAARSMEAGHGDARLDPWKEFDDLVLSFVMNHNVSARRHVSRLMCILKQTEQRHADFRTMVIRHLRTLHPEHPIHHLPTDVPAYALIKSLLTPTADYVAWQAEIMQRRRGTMPIPLEAWLKKRFVSSLMESKQTLHHYVLSCSTTAKHDMILYHKNYRERRAMIMWRLGTLWVGKTCVCGERFFRSHLHRCLYPMYCPVTPDLEIMEEGWQRDEQVVARDAETRRWTYRGHYTILDFFLNNRLFDHFNAFASVIDNVLNGAFDSNMVNMSSQE
jgi:hypothetical protein